MLNENQEWRLVTSLFWTVGFTQCITNTICLLIVGFMLEAAKLGFLKMALFYLVSGIGGNLFGAVCTDVVVVSNSPAIFGIIAGLLALLIVNWKALAGAGPMRIILIFVIVLIFIMYLLFGAVLTNVTIGFGQGDPLGNLGGFLTGLCFGLILMPSVRRDAHHPKSFEKKVRYVGVGLTFFYFTLMLLLFFLAINPTHYYFAK